VDRFGSQWYLLELLTYAGAIRDAPHDVLPSVKWLSMEAVMRAKTSPILCAISLACIVLGGCQKQKTVLSADNFRQKFDQVEAANQARPGDLAPRDIEAILGPGESISAQDSDLANPPPGVLTGDMKWSRWACQNEILLVGYADTHVASVVRLRR
jgi:hypothetical protein